MTGIIVKGGTTARVLKVLYLEKTTILSLISWILLSLPNGRTFQFRSLNQLRKL